MAKNKRYRWQNEKRAIKNQHDARNAHAHAMAAMKKRNAARAAKPQGTPGAMLKFYELVSLHPLKYKKVR